MRGGIRETRSLLRTQGSPSGQGDRVPGGAALRHDTNLGQLGEEKRSSFQDAVLFTVRVSLFPISTDSWEGHLKYRKSRILSGGERNGISAPFRFEIPKNERCTSLCFPYTCSKRSAAANYTCKNSDGRFFVCPSPPFRAHLFRFLFPPFFANFFSLRLILPLSAALANRFCVIILPPGSLIKRRRNFLLFRLPNVRSFPFSFHSPLRKF